MAKEKRTSKNGGSEPRKAVETALATEGLWVAAQQYRAAADGLRVLSPVEEDALAVVHAAFSAIDQPTPRRRKMLSAMADLARGAAEPGKTFNADLLRAIEMVQASIDVEPVNGEDRASNFLRSRTDDDFIAKLLEGLDDHAALALLHVTFGKQAKDKHRKPSGVVVDLLYAAVQRGVVFGAGATLSKRSTRPEIANLVLAAGQRASARNAAE